RFHRSRHPQKPRLLGRTVDARMMRRRGGMQPAPALVVVTPVTSGHGTADDVGSGPVTVPGDQALVNRLVEHCTAVTDGHPVVVTPRLRVGQVEAGHVDYDTTGDGGLCRVQVHGDVRPGGDSSLASGVDTGGSPRLDAGGSPRLDAGGVPRLDAGVTPRLDPGA